MKTAERDALLLVLAAASGAADAWSYLGLGHAFVANMTGNTVLLGLAVFTKHDLIHPAIALACYALGTAFATWLTRKVPPGVLWARAVSWSLFVEFALIAFVEAEWAARSLGSAESAHLPLTLLLGCLAAAIGMQSGAMLRLRIPGVVTTYITGTWTTLTSGVVKLSRAREVQPEPRVAALEERLLLQLGILAVYVLAAILTGGLSSRAPIAMGILPAGAVLTTALCGMAGGRNAAAR